MTLFVNLEQAAALLGTDVEGVEALLASGELVRGPYGISSADIACLLLEREASA